jgi:type I restriction enzyme S subunit
MLLFSCFCGKLHRIVYQLRFDVSRMESVSQGTAQKNLLLRDLSNFVIALPPLSEQHRVVRKIVQLTKHYDELEEKVKENLRGSETLMETVVKEAFASQIF